MTGGQARTARPVRVATVVGGLTAVWAGTAWASGHGLDALGELIALALVVFAGLPWAISLLLLLRKSSPATCIVGTLTAGIAFVVVLMAALPPQPLYVGLALAPAAAHLIKRARAHRAEQTMSAADGKSAAG
jgi:hypothetical protein